MATDQSSFHLKLGEIQEHKLIESTSGKVCAYSLVLSCNLRLSNVTAAEIINSDYKLVIIYTVLHKKAIDTPMFVY